MYYRLIEDGIIQYSDIKHISLLRMLELTYYHQYGKFQEALANIDNYIDFLTQQKDRST